MTEKHAAAPPAQAQRVPRAPVTDRVNSEPAILNGMTVTEAMWIGVLSLAAYLVIGGLVFAVTGWWQSLLVFTVFGTSITLWYASMYLAKIKRGRPERYYTHALLLWLSSHGFSKSRFIRHNGYWSLGRTQGFGFTSPLVVSEQLPDRTQASSPHTDVPAHPKS